MKTEDQVRNEADKILGFNGGGYIAVSVNVEEIVIISSF